MPANPEPPRRPAPGAEGERAPRCHRARRRGTRSGERRSDGGRQGGWRPPAPRAVRLLRQRGLGSLAELSGPTGARRCDTTSDREMAERRSDGRRRVELSTTGHSARRGGLGDAGPGCWTVVRGCRPGAGPGPGSGSGFGYRPGPGSGPRSGAEPGPDLALDPDPDRPPGEERAGRSDPAASPVSIRRIRPRTGGSSACAAATPRSAGRSRSARRVRVSPPRLSGALPGARARAALPCPRHARCLRRLPSRAAFRESIR